MHASFAYLPATPDVARQAVSAAWRVAGLGENDSSLDAMAARARWSAVLPEARVRGLRHAMDTTHAKATDQATADTPYHASDSNSLWLEGRLTWHLDRLLFAEEEPAIERLRLDRQEAGMRIAARVVDQLSKWQRARFEHLCRPRYELYCFSWLQQRFRNTRGRTYAPAHVGDWSTRLILGSQVHESMV